MGRNLAFVPALSHEPTKPKPNPQERRCNTGRSFFGVLRVVSTYRAQPSLRRNLVGNAFGMILLYAVILRVMRLKKGAKRYLSILSS